MIDFSTVKKIHFIGIGGVSLSSLAMFFCDKGKRVSGSDQNYSEKIIELTEYGCDVWLGVDPKKMVDIDLVVFSSAIKSDNEELIYAKFCGIPTVERYVLLRQMHEFFRATIAVAGTHGKTSTTSMLAKIMIDSNQKLYAHIGGDAVDIGNHFYSGDDYFLTEACEYKKSLLSFRPDIAVILNVENDHPDTFLNLSEIYDTFDTFIEQSRLVVINGDSLYYKQRHNNSTSLITFGVEPHNQYIIANLSEYDAGMYEYDLINCGILLGHIRLTVVGEHNVYNSAAAFVCGRLLRLCLVDMTQSLHSFLGVKRRFMYDGRCCGCRVYNDYAHHPSEILATLKTAKKLCSPSSKIIAVFQPHTYSRTQRLIEEFLTCFVDADIVVIAQEYSARELPAEGLSALQLYERLPQKNKFYFSNIIDIASFLIKSSHPDDIIMILGAGNINTLSKLLCP